MSFIEGEDSGRHLSGGPGNRNGYNGRGRPVQQIPKKNWEGHFNHLHEGPKGPSRFEMTGVSLPILDKRKTGWLAMWFLANPPSGGLRCSRFFKKRTMEEQGAPIGKPLEGLPPRPEVEKTGPFRRDCHCRNLSGVGGQKNVLAGSLRFFWPLTFFQNSSRGRPGGGPFFTAKKKIVGIMGAEGQIGREGFGRPTLEIMFLRVPTRGQNC